MKLVSLTATFGCLDHETLEFSNGMTLIGAPNGSGKSTWCALLRAMLYGLDTRQRDRKDAPADKNRYRPWSGAPMEGLLVCQHQGRIIQLRRTSNGGVPMGDFSATDRETGQPVEGLTADNAGEVLTGVSRDVFDRSVFLRQTGLAVSQSQELEKRITSLVSSGEEDVSWSEADSQLRTWQRKRRYHNTGLLPQLEEEEIQLHQTQAETSSLRQALAQVQSKAAALRRQMTHWESRGDQAGVQERYAEAAAELDAAEEKVQTLQAKLRDYEDNGPDGEDLAEDVQDVQDSLRSRRRLMGGFVFVVVLLTLAAAAVYVLPRYDIPHVPDVLRGMPQLPLLFSAAVAGGLWLLVLIFAISKAVADHRDKKELTKLHGLWEEGKDRYEEQSRALDAALVQRDQARRYFEAVRHQGGPYLPPEAEACRTSLHKAESEIARLQGQLQAMGDPALVDARLDELQEQAARLQTDYNALDIAIDALRQADAQLHARFSPQLSDRAGVYFSLLTGGQYDEVSLTRSLEVTVRESGSLAGQPLSLMSQGTADQLYLALRLAVADLLLPSPDAAPLILDDALLTFDDQRLDLALGCLTRLARDRQVILFTCQHRELDRLEGRENVTTIRLMDF